MLRVYKYEVPIADEFALTMPRGARPLAFQAQNNVPMLWALVDADAPPVKRAFRLAGTGHPIDEAAEPDYVGTAQTHGGQLVWHLFDCGEVK